MDTIDSLRQEIDKIHMELFKILQQRKELTLRIWALKKQQGLSYHNSERENQILSQFTDLMQNQKQDPEFQELLKNIMTSILREYEAYLRSKFI